MLNWLYKWYHPAGRWGAEEIASGFLALIEGGLVRRSVRAPALSRRLRRLRAELEAAVRALDD
jgi:hypothetical protein